MYRRLKTSFADVSAIYQENSTQSVLTFCCFETPDSYEAISSNFQNDDLIGKTNGTTKTDAMSALITHIIVKMCDILFSKTGPIIEEWLNFYSEQALDTWNPTFSFRDKENIATILMADNSKILDFPSFASQVLFLRDNLNIESSKIEYLTLFFTKEDTTALFCKILNETCQNREFMQCLLDCWYFYKSNDKNLKAANQKVEITEALGDRKSFTAIALDDTKISLKTYDFMHQLSESKFYPNQLVFECIGYGWSHYNDISILRQLAQKSAGMFLDSSFVNDIAVKDIIPISFFKRFLFRNKVIWENKEVSGG